MDQRASFSENVEKSNGEGERVCMFALKSKFLSANQSLTPRDKMIILSAHSVSVYLVSVNVIKCVQISEAERDALMYLRLTSSLIALRAQAKIPRKILVTSGRVKHHD
jgi:hypothetical protein